MHYKRVLARFLIFAFIGLLFEVFFGALGDLRSGDWQHFRGSTSPYMMIDYGLLGVFLMPIATPLIRRRIPLVLRAAVYMLGIFFVEYVSGILFHYVLHLHIWDYHSINYRGIPLHLHGQIALPFAIPWYLIGLFAEFMYKWVDACALLLVNGVTAERLETYLTAKE